VKIIKEITPLLKERGRGEVRKQQREGWGIYRIKMN
jgi:hypothetical protein